MSCVLRVSGGGRSALLTGDIEREQEGLLVRGIAAFRAGYRNRFGHPPPDVAEHYRERRIAIVATPACGAWRWLAAGPAEGRCERQAAGCYWHDTVAAAGR